MKNLFLIALLIFIIGCNFELTVPLNDDPIINKCFEDNEIKDLVQILEFFENQITISSDSKNIVDSYELFFRNLESEMKYDKIDLNISFNEELRLWNPKEKYKN